MTTSILIFLALLPVFLIFAGFKYLETRIKHNPFHQYPTCRFDPDVIDGLDKHSIAWLEQGVERFYRIPS